MIRTRTSSECGRTFALSETASGREMHNFAQQYYFVSDLHMGGDAQLQHCDYTNEFIAFLKELEKQSP